MAKVIDNIITEGLSGKISSDKYTFRRSNGNTYLVRKSISNVEPSAEQLAIREKFKVAAGKAREDLKDAAKKKEWQKIADASGGKYTTAYGAAFGYYYNLT